MDWYVTFGNSPNPTENPNFYTTIANLEWAKEVTINNQGRYLAVVKSSGTLSLSYVGAFPFPSFMAYVNC